MFRKDPSAAQPSEVITGYPPPGITRIAVVVRMRAGRNGNRRGMSSSALSVARGAPSGQKIMGTSVNVAVGDAVLRYASPNAGAEEERLQVRLARDALCI
jgi:hypothetical protein